MPQTAIAARKTFNPASFKRDFETLAVQNPRKATSMAADWRERLENALLEAETAAEIALESTVLGGSTLGLSVLAGYNEAKKAEIIRRWRNPTENPEGDVEKAAVKWMTDNGKTTADLAKASPFKEGGLKDPTKWLALPPTFWTTAALTGTAYLTRNSGFGSTTRAMALGSFAAFTAEIGTELGAKIWEKKNEKSDEKE